MPFITQGKTNWRYIIIVVILAAIVGAGSLGYLQYFYKPSQPYNPPPVLPKVFSTKEECEEKTECEECTFVTCDVIPLGKTLEEACGKDFKSGWQCIKSTGETTSWKTYRDEEYGLEVKYPEDFFYQEPKVAVTDCSAFDVSKECPDAIDAVKIITGYSSIDSNYWCLPMKQGLCDPEKEVEKLSLENVSWCLHTHSEGAAGSIYTEYYYTNVKDNKCFTLRLLVRTASSCKNYAKQEDIDRCEEFKESLPGILNEVLSTFKFIDEFCGTSTYGSCASDSDCVTDGCSDQVCRSKDEEPVVTTCEYKDCYNAQSYGLDCKCVDKKCQWAK